MNLSVYQVLNPHLNDNKPYKFAKLESLRQYEKSDSPVRERAERITNDILFGYNQHFS